MEHYYVVGRTEFESVTNPLKGDCSTAELTTQKSFTHVIYLCLIIILFFH